jgi:integrase
VAKAKLTQAKAERWPPPERGETYVADVGQPGLSLRVRASGARTWQVLYRTGGRETPLRRMSLGSVDKISLKAARDLARRALSAVASGIDPAAEQIAAARRRAAQLGPLVQAYIADLEARQATPQSVSNIASLLKRELVTPLGATTDIATLDRQLLVQRIAEVATARPGAAATLRTRVSVFFAWVAARGLVHSNPLAGYRIPRLTRAQAVQRPGRAMLREAELAAFWGACDAAGDPIFTGYLRTLLLTGCRRTELARARWSWLREVDGQTVLIVPASETKNGHAHEVPIPHSLLGILRRLPRYTTTDLIFPGRAARVMSGWSKRLRPVQRALDEAGVEPLTLHDLRRTARSWWTRLGAEPEVAELMLNHRARNVLVGIYDRDGRWVERINAAEMWVAKVFDLTNRGILPKMSDGLLRPSSQSRALR